MAKDNDDLDFGSEFMKLHSTPVYINKKNNENDIDPDDVNTEEDEDIALLKEKYKRKEKKKKKKKEKVSKLRIMMDEYDSLIDDDDINLDTSEDDDFLVHKKNRKGRKKELFDVKQARKKKKKNIEVRFNPQLTALRKILKDADSASADIRTVLDTMLKSKSRYVGKTLTDLLQALNTANSTRSSVVRDIANINKTIIDLKLKQDKANPKKDDKDVDNEEVGINLFRRLLSGNASRKEMLNAAKDYYNAPGNDYQEEEYTDNFNDYQDDDELNNEIQSRLADSAEANRRSKEGTSYIKFEPMGPEDVVMLHTTTGEWEMDAVDKYNQRMPDEYPRLSSDVVGDVRIDRDTKTAFDANGRRFRVIEIP